METETDNNVPAVATEPESAPLAIREDAVPMRQFAAEKITDVLPAAAYERIGQLPALDEKQVAELEEPVPDDEVDIKPDGAVYASHEYYRRKLNKVFGPLQWTLIPGSPLMPRKDTSDARKSEWYQRWVLFVGGCYVSEAIASRTLYNDNANMSMDDVAEAIKSDALKRCCKDLGLAKECWQKRWTENWRRQYCISVVVQTRDGNKNQWRRKDQDPFPREVSPRGPVPQAAQTASPPAAAQAPAPPNVPAGTNAATAQAVRSGGSSPAASPAKPVQVVPDAPAAAPAQAPASAPKPSSGPKVLDSQVRLMMARARTAGLIIGKEADPLIEWLEQTYSMVRVDSPGKTSDEIAVAMLKTLPPREVTTLVKKLDELAKGAKADGQAVESI